MGHFENDIDDLVVVSAYLRETLGYEIDMVMSVPVLLFQTISTSTSLTSSRTMTDVCVASDGTGRLSFLL